MGVRVAAVSMVKDEADMIVRVVERLLDQGVDRVLVLDNGSTDGTRDLLADLARRAPVSVFDDPDPRYLQALRLTELAERAHAELGARWILPFDADEWWTLPRLPRFGPDARVAPYFNHVATGLDDPAELDPVRRIQWRRAVSRYHKVVVRWRPHFALEMGSHHVLRKGKRVEAAPLEGLSLRHFPVRSFEQMVRKFVGGRQALEAAGPLVPHANGIHWREVGALLERGGHDVARERWLRDYFVGDPRGVLVHDPADEAC